jgi:hypothetical protein
MLESWSGAGWHVGGEDVVGMAVEVLAGPVIAHNRPLVCVAGRDLHVPQVHTGVEHGRDERMPEHMGMSPADPDSGCLGQAPEPSGGCMPVHPRAVAVEQDRPGDTVIQGAIDRPADRRRQRYQDDLAAFAADPQDPVAVLLAEIADVRPSGLEDPQAQQPQHCHQGEVVPG